MKNTETISVAMCTFNGGLYLQEQLRSIASQIRQPDELIVCDDGSSDNTIKIIEEYATQVSFTVRLFKNEVNLCPTKNFEKAISLCSGNIILLSDQDDVWYSDKLSVIAETFRNNPMSGAVFSNAEVVDSHLKSLGYDLWQSINFTRCQQHCFARGKAVAILLKHNVVTGATLAFRQQYKKVVLPIPNNWIHDEWIALIIAAVSDLTYIKKPLVKYRQHQKNQIGAVRKNLNKQFISARNKRSDYYLSAYNRIYDMRNRLLQECSISIKKKILLKIDAKLKHLAKRANMSQRLWLRLPSVLSEFIAYRYHRYSNGVKSFAKDLFLS